LEIKKPWAGLPTAFAVHVMMIVSAHLRQTGDIPVIIKAKIKSDA
jgi:hypothetical protein